MAYTGIYLALPAMLKFLAQAGLRRKNYAEQEIPLGGGLILAAALPLLLALGALARVPSISMPLCLIFSLGILGFGLAGLVDDSLGTASDKGFRGHVFALLRQGRLTSGMLKVIFGVMTACLVSLAMAYFYPKSYGHWVHIIVNILLLASAANLINLFDLRPGRAGKIFLLALLICAAFAREIDRFGGPVLLAVVAFLPLFRRDLRAEMMLGDTGANMLGAVLGLGMLFWLTWHAKLIALALLLLLQASSERYSFSRLIDRVGWLRKFDQWGRGAKP